MSAWDKDDMSSAEFAGRTVGAFAGAIGTTALVGTALIAAPVTIPVVVAIPILAAAHAVGFKVGFEDPVGGILRWLGNHPSG